jgi:hypothetical protein
MKKPAKPALMWKTTNRTPDPKQTRREKKYEARTGHNPRLGRRKKS